MTRQSLNRVLRRTYWVLGLVLALSLLAHIIGQLPEMKDDPVGQVCRAVYDYMKDMSLVFVTVVAAYLANVFQQRSKFLESLEDEWHDVLAAKTAIWTYTHIETPTHADWLKAFAKISETIDNMRVVYRNVGETDDLIGLYPFTPLHDMRRALQTVNPIRHRNITEADRKLVRDAMLQSFYALRESFLDELDIDTPSAPILAAGARRVKRKGSARWAMRLQRSEMAALARAPSASPYIDHYLKRLYELEEAGQSIAGSTAGAANGQDRTEDASRAAPGVAAAAGEERAAGRPLS